MYSGGAMAANLLRGAGGGGGGGGIQFVGSGIAGDQSSGVGRACTFASEIFAPDNSNPAILENDIVVVCMVKSGNYDAPDSELKPSGYTTLVEAYASDTGHTNLCVSYKVMGPTPDTSLTIPGQTTTSDSNSATVHVLRGVDLSTPMDVTPTTATGGNGGQPNAPAITPVTAGALIMATGAFGVTSAGPENYLTNPANMSAVNRHFAEYHALHETYDNSIGTALKTDWTSGAFDPDAFGGGTSSSSASRCAATLAFRPA